MLCLAAPMQSAIQGYSHGCSRDRANEEDGKHRSPRHNKQAKAKFPSSAAKMFLRRLEAAHAKHVAERDRLFKKLADGF
jgi:hypothetical protein